MPAPNHYVEISDDIHDALHEHRERTGVGPTRLMSYMRKCGLMPEGSNLKLATVESWFSRAAVSATKKDIQAVLNAYECIQDESHMTDDTHPRQLVILSDMFRKELSSGLSKRRHYSLKHATQNPDCPKALNFNLIKRIAGGQASFLEADVIRFVQRFIRNENR